jgi:hypothetical protein
MMEERKRTKEYEGTKRNKLSRNKRRRDGRNFSDLHVGVSAQFP